MSPKFPGLPASEYLEAVRVGMKCHAHETRARLSRRTTKSGARLSCWQCLICGHSSTVSNAAVDELHDYNGLAPFDETLADRYFRQQTEQRRSVGEAELAERRRKYGEYIRSDKWRGKRAAVLRRDGNLCQACLVLPATEVHHKTYEHVYDEPLFDLVSVCHVCHERITHMDRERWDGVYGRKA